MVAFDKNGNRRCKVFIRQFRKSSKLILKKHQLLSIVGNILLRRQKTVTFPLLVLACSDFLLGLSSHGQALLARACSEAIQVAMERLTQSFILFHIYKVGTQEVGVYDYNPPTLILKGQSEGNNGPAVLEQVHWPGTLCFRTQGIFRRP